MLIRPSDHKEHRSIHGTTRALLANMVKVFQKDLKKHLNLLV